MTIPPKHGQKQSESHRGNAASSDGPGAWGRGPASAPAQGGCVATSQSGHYPLVI